jgi:outer membrane protein TolC
MRILITAILAGLATFPVATAAKVLSSRDVISAVLQENPRLRAARARWEMMKQRIPQAKAWEDPMVGVDVERHGTTRFDTYTDNEWMASQAIPIAGRNLARGRAASAEAIAAFEELRRTELDLVTEARAALARLSGAYQQVEINRRNQELLRQFTDISRAKYESGTQSQADVLIAQTDLARLAETQAQLEREVSDQESRLNVLMNRPAASTLNQPANLSFTKVPWSRDKLEEFAFSHRPEVAIAAHKIEAEKARVQLARRQWIPDPRLRVEARQFRQFNGIHEYDTGIFFEVPWTNFKKYSANVAEAKSSLEATEEEYEAVRSEVRGLVRDQLTKIETAAHNYDLFRNNISPLANQAVETIRSSYESDKASFLDLITARRTLQDVDSAQLQHLVEHQVAVAELDAIIGRTPGEILERTGK